MMRILTIACASMIVLGLSACAKPDKKHTEARYTPEAIEMRKDMIRKEAARADDELAYMLLDGDAVQ